MNAPENGQVGTRLLFENERVRVWDLRLEPGESTGQHRHEHEYFYVVIGDGALQRVDPDGTPAPPKTMQDGDVHYRRFENEYAHAAVNVGDKPWRNIVVELLEPAKRADDAD